ADEVAMPEGRRDGDVGRIASSRNQDASDARRIVSGVERVPAAAEMGLEPGAEIHRIGFLRNADVAEISGAIARGHIHAAAEGDGKMREVATDPPFLLEGIVGVSWWGWRAHSRR